MALLIDEPVVSELYTKAEECFTNNQYTEAVLNVVAAFEFMKAKEIDRRFGSGILQHRWNAQKANKESEDHHVKNIASVVSLLYLDNMPLF